MFCSRCGTWASDESTLCPLCGVALQNDNLPRPAGASPFVAPAPHVVPLVTYGGFWRRVAAVLLDTAVLFLPGATIRVLLGLEPLASLDPQSMTSWAAAGIEFVVDWFYGALLISSSARGTLGLQIMELQVTDLRGGRVSFMRASWRYWAQLLSFLTFGVGYLLQLVTPRRQALHDLVSFTVVVRTRRAPEALAAPVLRIAP